MWNTCYITSMWNTWILMNNVICINSMKYTNLILQCILQRYINYYAINIKSSSLIFLFFYNVVKKYIKKSLSMSVEINLFSTSNIKNVFNCAKILIFKSKKWRFSYIKNFYTSYIHKQIYSSIIELIVSFSS